MASGIIQTLKDYQSVLYVQNVALPSTTVNANSYETATADAHIDGWTAIGAIGYYTNNQFLIPFYVAVDRTNQEVSMLVKNISAEQRTGGSMAVYVLYQKNL